jgi:hypothetical protein
MNLRPDLVTITVGANDIRFADCLTQVLGVDKTLMTTAGGSPCSGQTFPDHLKALNSNLSFALARIRDMYGPTVPIAVTGYFIPTPAPVTDPAKVSEFMKTLLIAKNGLEGYVSSGGGEAVKRAVTTYWDLGYKAMNYQSDIYARAARIVGQLNGNLSKTVGAYDATFVPISFSNHDITADYDGSADAWVLAPKIDLFLSYYGAGGLTYNQQFTPAHRCVSRPACDTHAAFKQIEGDWLKQHGTLIVQFWSNDFPHLTTLGHEAMAGRIIDVMKPKWAMSISVSAILLGPARYRASGPYLGAGNVHGEERSKPSRYHRSTTPAKAASKLSKITQPR